MDVLYTLLSICFRVILIHQRSFKQLFEGVSLAIVIDRSERRSRSTARFLRASDVVHMMIFSPISGMMIDHFSIGRTDAHFPTNYYRSIYSGWCRSVGNGMRHETVDGSRLSFTSFDSLNIRAWITLAWA